MFKNQSHLIVLVLVVFTLTFSACSPEETEVLVTRLVEATPEVITRVVTEFEEVEVTRIVEQIEEVPGEVTREVMMEETPLGSSERPIKLLFVPSVDVDATVSGGEVLADALEAATGFRYEVSVPTSYAAAIEEMCASPDDTLALIPAQEYVLANNRCGIIVGGSAIRSGLPWSAAQIVVPMDSDIESIEDLSGLTGAFLISDPYQDICSRWLCSKQPASNLAK